MAFADFIHLTQASSGATRNSGTNGDFVALLDWALPQANWTIAFSTGNARYYLPPAGNGFGLHVYHDSTVSGDARRVLVRGAESASSATALTDPFPTVALVADTSSNLLVSETANTTTRDFDIIAWSSGVIVSIKPNVTANRWNTFWFGDVTENDVADTWGTMCAVRNSASNAIINLPYSPGGAGAGSGSIWFARDISGTVKSSRGIFQHVGTGTTLGLTISALPNMDAGYLGKLRRDRIAATCLGSTTVTAGANMLMRRGFIPQTWVALAGSRGTVTEADQWTDSSYDPASRFILRCGGSDANLIVLEKTNTWIPPTG